MDASPSTAERFGDDFGGERMWGLKELPYPDPIAFTPETGGWLVVAALLLLMALWLGWRLTRQWHANAYRRHALRTLRYLDRNEQATLPVVLRKVALLSSDRNTVAFLRGNEWIDWLNGCLGERVFLDGDADLLDQLAYAGRPLADAEWHRLLVASRTWVKLHHA
jgi:hypothetical protein